jgi:cytoskeletal protein CcmA (bactofilin family)
MQYFTRLFPRDENTNPSDTGQENPSVVVGLSERTLRPAPSGAFLSQGVSIIGSVKFRHQMFIDGKVQGTIESTGTLTIGEHARIWGDIRAKSVNVQGMVQGNIFATERCELQAGCTLHGDIEATLLGVNENAIFRGSAKIGNWKSLPASRSPEPNDSGAGKGSPRSPDLTIRGYDEATDIIETHERAG